MRILYLRAGRRCACPVLMRAAVGRVRIVIAMAGVTVAVVVFPLLIGVAVIGARRVSSARLAVSAVIRQLAGLVTFAGPEKREGSGSRDGSRFAED